MKEFDSQYFWSCFKQTHDDDDDAHDHHDGYCDENGHHVYCLHQNIFYLFIDFL
jgi:hypothetical protein